MGAGALGEKNDAAFITMKQKLTQTENEANGESATIKCYQFYWLAFIVTSDKFTLGLQTYGLVKAFTIRQVKD